MKRLIRYVNRPAFGAAAGIFIVLALIFAFLNIFNVFPATFSLESFIIRIILGIAVLGVWVLLNIPPPRLNGFVIAMAELVEEREPDGALYDLLRKPRRSLLSNRELIEEEDEEPALQTSRFAQNFLRARRAQPNQNLPSGPATHALPSGLNTTATRPPSANGAADASADDVSLARISDGLATPLDGEGERTPGPPKKFTPPPALWKEAIGAPRLTDHLRDRLDKQLKDAGLGDVTVFDSDGYPTNRWEALREGEYPNAGAIIWGWQVYGTRRDFVPVVELPKTLEEDRERYKLAQIIGLKSFELGQQTAKHGTVFSAFVSGLGAYAQQHYAVARNEFSLALIAAYMYGATRQQDPGIDRSIIYFFLGNTYYYLQDYENAVNSYREALALDPHMYEARHNLGVNLFMQGKIDFSIKRLIEVIQSKPNLAIARYNIGMAYLKKKQFVTARREFNNAIKLNERLAAAYRGIGQSYSEERSFTEAINYFRDALSIDPNFAQAHLDIALLYYQQAEPELRKIRVAEREVRRAEMGRDVDRIREARGQLSILKSFSAPLIQMLDNATPELREALSLNPDLAEAHYYLGLILDQQNIEDQAEQSLLEAVKLRRDFADAHEALADIYEERGRNDLRDYHLKLMGEARSAIALTNADALIKAAMGMRLNKALPQARETLEKALKFEPRNSKAQFELGVVFQEMGELDRAMGMFQSVLRLPNPPDEVYEQMAKIYRQQGQEEQATALIEKAAKERPESAKLQYYLGNTYRRQQKTAQAIEAYQRSISLDPQQADSRFNLGLLYLGKRQLQDAALQFEEVVHLREDDHDTYRYLGRAYASMRRIDEAVDALCKAIAIKDDALEARLELGQIYLNQAESEAAREQFEAILKYDPNNMRARELLGKAFAQGGQIDMAIETFQNMLLIVPDSHAAHYNLGVAYASEKRYDEAVNEFQKVIQLKRDDADAYFNLGLAYDQLESPYEAIDAFQRAIKYRPAFSAAYFQLGQVYFKINRMEDGLKAVQYAEQLKKS
jgi:tetratricopeptide (TPR) repeat protein